MLKKLQLFCLTLFSSVLVNSQTNQNLNSCANFTPPQQWEDWLSKEVEKFKQNRDANNAGKTQLVTYDIPVIVHVIHFGEPVGTFPNIDTNQIKTQIQVMNDDFAGTGLNSGTIPAPFATKSAGNTGIRFCRAAKNQNGVALNERGVDRIDVGPNGFNWENPNTPTVNIVDYINNIVIPATYWDPTKYLNIWISERSPTLTVNGFATYPSGTSLTGLFNGQMGTATNDGIWCWTKAFGTIGTLQAPFNKGRTMTHETGHWLGLRHIWGDGNCLSDYCSDTPPAKNANSGCPSFPSYVDRCGVGQSPDGEMFMNFMDRVEDNCMSLFTVDQSIRMFTAISQCPNRNLLGTHGLCVTPTTPSASAVASFSVNGAPCLNRPFTPLNTSSGFPYPTYIWSSSPPAAFSPGPTVPNPAITFNTPGTYTLTLVATNTVNNASFTMAVTALSCTPLPVCIDSLRIIKNTDTLTGYKAINSSLVVGCQSGFAGYVTGSNCYKDKEYAQYFPPSSYSSTPYPQVNSVIVLFDSQGTKLGINPISQVSCKIYGGSIANGPVSALAVRSDSLMKVTALTTRTATIKYIGNPNYSFSINRIIPFKFNFASPVIINSPGSGFFAAVDVPQVYAGDSIRIFGNTIYNTTNDSSSWALTFNNTWRPLKSYRKTKIQLAMIPQITCSPITGINELATAFNSNISVMPNPNNGVFNLVFTLPKEEDLYVRIYNSVGQLVSATQVENVTNNVISVDLNDKPDGIYFTEISNGSERVVKKVIISH